MRKKLGFVLGLALLAGSLSAKSATFGFDQSHTEVSFRISHWVVNKVRGHFTEFDGAIKYDDKKVEKSSVDVSINAASINTRHEKRDKHLRSADFFDVEKHPKLAFKSTKVAKGAKDGELEISGNLSMRGVTKPVVLYATITGTVVDGQGKERIGFEAKGKVNRMDYGIAWNMDNKSGTMMLGEEVEIEISGEAVKK